MQHGRRRSGRQGWRQWREAEARAVLAEFAASGASLAAFARQRGVAVKRLSYWRQRLASSARVDFVPVAIAPPGPPAEAFVEITVRGVVLRARTDVEAARLARLVAALASALPPC